MVPLSPPKGMDDLLPGEFTVHQRIVEVVRTLFRLYGFLEVETPSVEYYDLFAVKSGDEILSRMYVFEDAHGRKLVLRPEMTAPIARLVASRLSRSPQPIRLGYVADCYRLDEPQWGRRRRFYHGGFEIFGAESPAADAECLVIFSDFFKKIGVENYRFKLGHVGVHRALMSSAGIPLELQERVLGLLDHGRLDEALELLARYSTNMEPVRVFSELARLTPGAAVQVLQQASSLLERVEAASRELENLWRIVELASQVIDPERLVYHPGFARGLSYYTGFIFEAYAAGADIALGGGGRYDELVSLIGGVDMPGVGFAIGITRVMQYLMDSGLVEPSTEPPYARVVPLTEEAIGYALKVAAELRRTGVPAELELSVYKAADAIRRAERRGNRYVVMVGRREIESGSVTIRDIEDRVQQIIKLDELYGLAKRFNEKRHS